MALVAYKGLSVLDDDDPAGPGGNAIHDNFKELTDRAPPYLSDTSDPGANDDSAGTGGNGSFWQRSLWLNSATNTMWVCIDHTATAAVWRKITQAPLPGGWGNLIPYSGNPVLSSNGHAFCSVFKVGATWHAYAGTSAISHWTSTDGLNWGTGSVVSGSLDADGVPSAWYEDGTYYMLFRNDDAGNRGVNLATSSDGATWVQDANSPVLEGAAGEWDDDDIDPWGIIKVGSTYYLFYNTIASNRSIGVATSTDLTTWVKDANNPIFTGGRFCSWIIKVGEYYYLFVMRYTSGANYAEIELYRDITPTFLDSSREDLGVIKETISSANWDGQDLDTPCIPTDDIYRDSFATTNGEIWMYYAGQNTSNEWRSGVAIQGPDAQWAAQKDANDNELVNAVIAANTTLSRAPVTIAYSGLTADGCVTMYDPDNAGNSALVFVTFFDNSLGASGETGRLGYVGYASGSNSHFTIANEIEDADIRFLVDDGGVTRTTTFDASQNRWDFEASAVYTTGQARLGWMSIQERTAGDAPAPPDAQTQIWMSNGTTSLDGVEDGDLVCTSTVGAVTTHTILHNHSGAHVVLRTGAGRDITYSGADAAARGTALAAAITAASAGDTIYLGPGTYTLAAKQAITSQLSFVGSGPQTNISFAGVALEFTGADDCLLRDLTVTGTVELDGSDRFTITNCHIDGTGQTYAIYAHTGSVQLRLHNNLITGGTYGLYGVTRGEQWHIEGNTFTAASTNNIYLTYDGAASVADAVANPPIIANNFIANAGTGGLYALAIHDLQIRGNEFERNGGVTDPYAIKIECPIEMTICDNFFEYNTENGDTLDAAVWIVTDDASAGGRGFNNNIGMALIHGNTMQNEKRGIRVDRTAAHPVEMVIRDNFFFNMVREGIIFNQFDANWRVVITGNRMDQASRATGGISVVGTSVTIDGAGLVIAGNCIDDYSIGVRVDSLTNVDITNNDIYDCGYAFRLYNNSTVNLYRNRFREIDNGPTFGGSSAVNDARENVGTPNGWITEANGEATISNGTTTEVVTHGLSATPTAGDITVTPSSDMASAAKFWVDTLTSTQFTINVDADPGGDITFAWSAIIR